jgi:uncharacterized protein (TIGR04255 family)
MATTLHPFAFGDPDTGNVPLNRAPLIRTIAQVRFPHLTRFTTNEDAVAHSIAGALADQYPLMSVGNETAVTITAEGISEMTSPTRLWRLASGDRSWQVTFCGTFLSIDTSRYESRSDFAQRLSEAWTALNRHIAVPYIERLGIRYLNQLTDLEHLGRLPEFVRPEILGVAMAQDDDAVLASSLTEARYRFADNASFLARWGLLPAGASIENSGPSYDYPTWVLDMDSFREYSAGTQGGETIYEDVRELALRAYQFFRWTVTEESLDAFGGER